MNIALHEDIGIALGECLTSIWRSLFVFSTVSSLALQNVEIYNSLMINVKKLSVQLEEKLLWKMLGFLGWGGSGNDPASNELDMEADDGECCS